MSLPDYYRYISIFAYYDGGISITFPDLPGCVSHSDTDDEAIKNAKEVLMLHMRGMETDNEEITAPSSFKSIKCKKNEMAVLIEVFMPPFREKQNTKFIKKTLSVPYWLNAEAENKGINFSATLQNALKEQLNIQGDGKF